MSRRGSVLGILLCGIIAGNALATSTQGAPVISFATVDQGLHSRVAQPLQAVIRTPVEWAALWARHAGLSVVPPAVDFSTEMIIAVFAGERPTSGYEVEITRVLSTDQGLRVTYQEHAPPAGTLVRPVLTTPFHVIRLPRSEKPVHMLPKP